MFIYIWNQHRILNKMKYSDFENIHFDFFRKFRASETLKFFFRQIFIKDTSLDAEFYVEQEYMVVFAKF